MSAGYAKLVTLSLWLRIGEYTNIFGVNNEEAVSILLVYEVEPSRVQYPIFVE